MTAWSDIIFLVWVILKPSSQPPSIYIYFSLEVYGGTSSGIREESAGKRTSPTTVSSPYRNDFKV